MVGGGVDDVLAVLVPVGGPVDPFVVFGEGRFAGAVGAYGGFFIPKSYGSSIALTGSPHAALWTFFAFYLVCIVITWWHYARKNAEMPC